jgi:hypothetical protein
MNSKKYTYAIQSDNPTYDDSTLSFLATCEGDADAKLDAFRDAMSITKSTLKSVKPTKYKPKQRQ